MSEELKPLACPFCGGECDPNGWLGGDGARGPECESCGATAESVAAWNRRAQPEPATPAEPDDAARWDFMFWLAELMRLADVYHDASTAAAARVRRDVQRHASAVGMHWRAKAMIESTRKPPAAAPSVAPEPLMPMQAGMCNAELREAWWKKLPTGPAPSDRDLSAFAIGAEVGFKRAQDLGRQDWDRVHHALKDAGVHPGRTDDHLADVIAKALRAQPEPAAPADPLAGMSEMNRTIAYSAASKLREIGYEWTGKEWAAPSVAPEPVAWHTEDFLTDPSAVTFSKQVADRWKVKGWPVTPMFYAAHPPRAPLTDERLKALYEDLQTAVAGHDTPFEMFTFLTRALETAHGISAAAIGAAK